MESDDGAGFCSTCNLKWWELGPMIFAYIIGNALAAGDNCFSITFLEAEMIMMFMQPFN